MKTMPKKTSNDGEQFIEAAINSMLSMKRPGESNRDLFVRVHGREPKSQSELNTFTNRLRLERANPSSDLIGKFVAAHDDLRNMTMGEFFGLSED